MPQQAGAAHAGRRRRPHVHGRALRVAPGCARSRRLVSLGRLFGRARAVAAGINAAIEIVGVARLVRQVVDNEDLGLGSDVHPLYSLLTAHCSLLTAHCLLLTTYHTHHLLLTSYYLLLTLAAMYVLCTYCSPLAAHCSLLATYYPPYSPRTTCSPLTTYVLLTTYLGSDVHPTHAVDEDLFLVGELIEDEGSGGGEGEGLEELALVVVRVVRARVPTGNPRCS